MAAAYLTHHQKVLRLYKKSLRHIESWCIFRDKYSFYACLLRARFDENKHEKDMMKATMMLKAGEEEFWANQHPQPYLFPDSPGGTSYERYECYKVSDKVKCTYQYFYHLEEKEKKKKLLWSFLFIVQNFGRKTLPYISGTRFSLVHLCCCTFTSHYFKEAMNPKCFCTRAE
uniref:NADH dehydrogenase [ubiquinone] 1 beta subcomplex subunit 9 n=1 Tax=Cyprinus carpio TaxID=7962 RepID=A0A8C1PE15_CYPCA